MPDPVRLELVAAAHTVVVKVGTRVLTHADGSLNYERIERLADEIHAIGSAGGKLSSSAAARWGPASDCSV